MFDPLGLAKCAALGACWAIVVATFAGSWASQQSRPAIKSRDDAAAESLGWRLGVQTWTFRDRTASEAIDAVVALGVRYVELYSEQPLSPERRRVKVGPEMGADAEKALLAKLHDSGVKAVSFGVVELGKDAASDRRTFEFAKRLGLETITCEPLEGTIDAVESLCAEFGMNAAIHNHPKPSRYWNPEAVLKAVNGRSKRLGACADTGHWPRSGLVALECLRSLEGRILTSHFKDLRDGVDQPWGTGKSDARAMLQELHRQRFRGVISLEYETGSGAELEANAAKCVAFFDSIARELAATAR